MKHSISPQQIKSVVKSLYQTALDAANPYNAVISHIKRKGNILLIGRSKYNLSQYKNIYVAGSGKAAAGMGKALEEKLGDLITKGIISIDYGCGAGIKLKRIMVNEAGHPLPDKSSVAGARKIKALLAGANANDLVIYLATGGGSATLTLPAEGITLKELRDTTRLLLKSGATLQEMNYVRKHIDLAKGGQLARDAYPAPIITLVISDVVGDPLDMVSSGSTVPDPYTFKDAYEVLKKYSLLNRIPKPVRRIIETGLKGTIPETPKENEPCFKRAKTILIGSNTMALKAMAQTAKSLGVDVVVNTEPVIGEARDVARRHAINAFKLAKSLSENGHSSLLSFLRKQESIDWIPACAGMTNGGFKISSNKPKRPLFILSGGETTVTVKGNGKGGRNQEYTLAFILAMERLGFDRFICLSCSTDGIDYIKDAAGSMVDGTSLMQARKIGLNPKRLLNNNDSYHFHKPINTLVKTGPTGTNVNDIQIIVVW